MTQASQSQGDGGRFKEEDINNKARDLVRFFLASTGRKTVIKRQEIMDKVMKDMTRGFNVALERARHIMQTTFGLNVVTLEEPNKTFCVVNEVDLDTGHVHLEWGDIDNQQASLLMVVLSIIFMSGELAQDEDVWKALKRIGLDYEKPDNAVFGDIKKLITQEFVQQGYLVYRRLPETDPAKYEFSWGARAHALTTKEDVLSFVCQIYEGMDMFEWPQQYDAIHGEGAATKAKAEHANGSQSQMEVD